MKTVEDIPQVYHNVIALRQMEWGHLPLNNDILNFFERIADHTTVNRVLEFGYNFGFSAAMQLTVHENATLTSYDPKAWRIFTASYDKVMPPWNMKAPHLGQLTFLDRLIYRRARSGRVLEFEEGRFDYAFIDGAHLSEYVIEDITNCMTLTNLLAIDNLEIEYVAGAVAQFVEDGAITEIDSVEYEKYHPKVGLLDHKGILKLYRVSE